jgi:uncharacterized membrane protein
VRSDRSPTFNVNATFSLLVPCVIIAIASVPLALEVVPPNPFYGFRTRKTLADRELWFRANRFAGFALFIAAATSAIIFLAEPEYGSGRSIVGLAVFLAPLVIALGASFAYLRRLN